MDSFELNAAVHEADRGNSCRLTLDLVQLAQQDMLTRGGRLDHAVADAHDINKEDRHRHDANLAPSKNILPGLDFTVDHPSEFRWGDHHFSLWGYNPDTPNTSSIVISIDRDAGKMETRCDVNNKQQTFKSSFDFSEPIKHL